MHGLLGLRSGMPQRGHLGKKRHVYHQSQEMHRMHRSLRHSAMRRGLSRRQHMRDRHVLSSLPAGGVMKIDFTPAAEKFIRRLIMFDGPPGSGLRLLVSPGGCSGMSAEFSVEPAPREGEQVYTHGAIRLFLP